MTIFLLIDNHLPPTVDNKIINLAEEILCQRQSDAFMRVAPKNQKEIINIAEEILCQMKERARSIVDLCEELAL